jgi:hypothetical protein
MTPSLFIVSKEVSTFVWPKLYLNKTNKHSSYLIVEKLRLHYKDHMVSTQITHFVISTAGL